MHSLKLNIDHSSTVNPIANLLSCHSWTPPSLAFLNLAEQHGFWPFAWASLAHCTKTVNDKVTKRALELSVTESTKNASYLRQIPNVQFQSWMWRELSQGAWVIDKTELMTFIWLCLLKNTIYCLIIGSWGLPGHIDIQLATSGPMISSYIKKVMVTAICTVHVWHCGILLWNTVNYFMLVDT